ncbi:MAG TPA: prolyl oligopeptidase family serine peptidase [Pseudonocardiaceae bacterium]|nr:prolyl oligopeptidase family serine peptidase [Pseudonocardiaceae bacterium]
MSNNGYPRAERLDVVENLHGHEVADPYRWLEDASDPRTREWSAAQDELCRAHLDSLPGREESADRLRGLVSVGSVTVPVWRAGRAFFTRREPGQEHPVLLVREPDGTERALIDPDAIDPSGRTTLDGWRPSIEGDRLAYQLSVGGDEEAALHVLDVGTGRQLDGPIDRCRYSAIAWLPGGEELFYVRRLPPSQVPEDEVQFHRRVWRHRVGADPESDVLIEGPGLYDDLTFYFGVSTSRDGRWLLVSASPGTAPRNSVWIADLHGDGALRAVLDQDDAVRCAAWVERDGRLYLLTTHGAPRWRLAVADPATPRREHWRELVAEEPDSVLDGVRWLDTEGDPVLVLARTRHAVAELHLHDPQSGAHRGTVPLPGTGSFTGLSTVDALTTDGRGSVWIGYTDFTTPPGVLRFDMSTKDTSVVEPAPGATGLPAVHTRQVGYTSADGTAMRMFVVSGAGTPDRPRPALLTGYGGFSISNTPFYSALALTWAAAGGVWALASLRGGGEEGEDWHRAGMRERKQNVFDDFHAAASHLVDTGWTATDRLAIFGGSNGGLLVGAALTQRPRAYRAVVCSAPLLDMVRYERFSIGRTWNDEYGSADDPTELGWLLSYSPYHHVRDGETYPAVLFTVFESDTRVDPCHARKMCAAMQHATATDQPAAAQRPVLLRRETDVGHGARSVSRMVDLLVDEVAFLAAHTGLDLSPLRGS